MTPLSADARLVRTMLLVTAIEGVVVAAVGLGTFLGAGSGPAATRAVVLAGVTLGLTAVSVIGAIRAFADRLWLERLSERARRAAFSEARLRIAVAAFYATVLLVVLALFGVSLRMNPDFPSVLAAFRARGLLPFVWFSLIAFQAAVLLHALASKSFARSTLAFSAGAGVTVLILAYWYGAEGQLLRFNVNMRLTDQTAYMDYARLLKETGYTYPGDFNRMPLYPLLLSAVFRPGMTDSAYFLAAKYFNLFLSILLMAGLAVILFRRYERLTALNLTLIIAFSVFIFKAGWVQAELLFYFVNTWLFLLLWRLLERPDYRTAIAAGAIAGVAHLTKASLWPGLFVFAFLAILRGVVQLRRRRRAADGAVLGTTWTVSPLSVALGAVVFLTVLAPYLRMSRQMTGRYFYNVNSTFYVWYDSWEEAVAGTKAHGDRVGWPVMPASEIPGPAKYLREHTPSQMLERVLAGGQEVMTNVLRSYGYFDYLKLYAGLVLVAAALRGRRFLRLVSEHVFVLAFFLAYFSIYIVLYFWYAPIAAGDRLILALFIPLLLVQASALQALLRGERFQVRGRQVAWSTVVNIVVLCLVAADIRWALVEGVYILRGGG